MSHWAPGNVDLPASGVSAGTYGDGTHVAQVTVDAKGLVTAASNVVITGAGVTSLDSITGAVSLVAGTNVTITDNSPGAGQITIAASGGGGGGLSQSYIGYNTVGGTTEGVTGYKQVYKPVTLGTSGLLASVDLYCHGDGVHVQYVAAAVWDDNAGAPGKIIAANIPGMDAVSGNFLTNLALNTTPRWLSTPIGTWLVAGSYWLEALVINQTLTLYYDGSGGDFTGTLSQGFANDSAGPTNSSRNYSLRGNLVQ